MAMRFSLFPDNRHIRAAEAGFKSCRTPAHPDLFSLSVVGQRMTARTRTPYPLQPGRTLRRGRFFSLDIPALTACTRPHHASEVIMSIYPRASGRRQAILLARLDHRNIRWASMTA
jgi:hypothetical protein